MLFSFSEGYFFRYLCVFQTCWVANRTHSDWGKKAQLGKPGWLTVDTKYIFHTPKTILSLNTGKKTMQTSKEASWQEFCLHTEGPLHSQSWWHSEPLPSMSGVFMFYILTSRPWFGTIHVTTNISKKKSEKINQTELLRYQLGANQSQLARKIFIWKLDQLGLAHP